MDSVVCGSPSDRAEREAGVGAGKGHLAGQRPGGNPGKQEQDVGPQQRCEASSAAQALALQGRGGGAAASPRGVRVWRSLEPEPQSGRLPGSFTVQAPPQVTLGLERRPRFCFLSLLGLPTRETGSMA